MIGSGSITVRFVFLFVSIISIVLTLFGLWNQYNVRDERMRGLDEQLDGIAQRLSTSLPTAVWQLNDEQIANIVRSEIGPPFVRAIQVNPLSGKSFGLQRGANGIEALDAGTLPDAGIRRRIELTISTNGTTRSIGDAIIQASDSHINAQLQHERQFFIVQMIGLNLIIALALYFALRMVVLKPLRRIGEALHEIAEGDASIGPRLPMNQTREFNAVSVNFNQFVDKLERKMGGSLDRVHASINAIAAGDLDGAVVFDADNPDSVLGRLAFMRDKLRAISSEQARNAMALEKANFVANQALELTHSAQWEIDGANLQQLIGSPRYAALCGEAERPPDWHYDLRSEFWPRLAAARPEQIQPLGEEAYSALKRGAMSFDASYQYRRPSDGRVVWLHSAGQFERDSNGQVLRIYGVTQDITTLKEAEETTLRAQKAAEESNRAKSDFLANMSHEIRTPLNAIIGMSDLVMRTELNPKQRTYLTKVHASALSLLRIINDILDFSKIEAGKMDVEIVDFKLDEVMDNLAGLVAESATDKGLELLFAIQPKVPSALSGDPLRLGQILINLVGNAIKFTEHGEIVVGVELEEKPQGRGAANPLDITLHFWVKDTGIGMTAAQQQGLFTAFSQADTSSSRRFGGTGLGLSISRTLVELMNGRIWVESEFGAGTTFHFVVRLRKQPNHEALETPPAAIWRGSRVLVVDDNESALQISTRLLDGLGFKVSGAKEGRHAVELVVRAQEEGNPFELVLLDWMMPGISGIETLKQLKRLAAHMPKVIIVTHHNRGETTQTARQAGVEADAIVGKPLTASVLNDAIARVLSDRKDAAVERPPRRADTNKGMQTDRLRGLKVLLVEDNEVNRELAYELLTNAEIEVDTANDGQQAIDALLASPYDMVLMDCQMPVMDGYVATRHLRADPRFAKIPIIAMTANAMAGDRQRVLDVGMNDHIPKPIDIAVMFNVIARWDPRAIAATGAESPNDASAEIHEQEAEHPFMALNSIDTRAGLAVVAGNQNLYRRLLDKFAHSERDFATRYQLAVVSTDRAAAVRAAHTLKGLAANIGAASLTTAAAALETASENAGVDPGHIARLIQSVKRELDGVITDIERLRQHDQAREQARAEAETSTDISPQVREQGRRILAELAALIDASDADAVELGARFATTMKSTSLQASADLLAQTLDEFDFEKAAGIVPAIWLALAD